MTERRESYSPAELRWEGGGTGRTAGDDGICQSRKSDQRRFTFHGEHRAAAHSTPLKMHPPLSLLTQGKPSSHPAAASPSAPSPNPGSP